jgi:tetratricopeptide (TPR) repeat protein
LEEDTISKLENAILNGMVGAFDEALAHIASIDPDLQCNAVVSAEHSLILWNQGKYLQAAEILRKAIDFAQSEGNDMRTQSIYRLIKLLLAEIKYRCEGDFTAVRDIMQEIRLWLQNVTMEQLDDVQVGRPGGLRFCITNGA